MHTKGSNKEIILGNQWRNIELSELRKKEYINKRRRYLLNVDLRNWNVSEATVKANPSINKPIKAERTFNSEQYYDEIKKKHS
jgi:hypothetical protein